jgi:hypothetical protein
MKYLFLAALASVLVCGGCGDDDTDAGPDCTQGEYSGDFEITTQAVVETIAGYTSISGDMIISCPSCTDLSELICLTSVGEDLEIHENSALTNLDGLNALTSVGGDLMIGGWNAGNTALTNLDGLSGITSVGRYLMIDFNDALPGCEVCDLLDQITSGPDWINVQDNLYDSCTPVPGNCS